MPCPSCASTAYGVRECSTVFARLMMMPRSKASDVDRRMRWGHWDSNPDQRVSSALVINSLARRGRVGAPVVHHNHLQTHFSSYPCNWSPRCYRITPYPHVWFRDKSLVHDADGQSSIVLGSRMLTSSAVSSLSSMTAAIDVRITWLSFVNIRIAFSVVGL